jgi:carbonic anhydrase
MSNGRFGIVITCIDGRVHEPVAAGLKARYQLDHINAITIPGADRALADEAPELIAHLKSSAQLSISHHRANVLAIVGHHDCAANPGSREEHVEQIKKAMQVAWYSNLPVTLVGLWVNEEWEVEVVG